MIRSSPPFEKRLKNPPHLRYASAYQLMMRFFITNIFDCYSSNSFYFLYEAKRNSVIVRAALIARKACLVSGL